MLTSTVIVSQPGVLREALAALLASYSNIAITGCVSGALLALNLIRQQPPQLLVIDSTLPEDEAIALVQQVKQAWPTVACLVLSITSRTRQEFLNAGADEILPRFSSTEEMEQALRRLLPDAVV